MSQKAKTLPKLAVDGFSFLGGGVRCAVGQYATMCTIMHKMGLIPEEMLHSTKYLSCNSGGSFTMATLLCYPNMKTIWPLDKVKDMSQKDLESFYQTYWMEPTKTALATVPGVATDPAVFDGVSSANIGLNSWLNAFTTFAMVPFSDAIGNMALKDVPLAKAENKVISFGATANAKSSIRTTTGALADLDVYLSSIAYDWSKDYSQIPAGKNSSMVGFPVNLIYGFGNQVVNDATFFNGDVANITYTQSSTPLSQCNVAKVLQKFLPFLKPTKEEASSLPKPSSLRRRNTSSPNPVTITPPNLKLGQSQLGESMFLTLVGASSSFIGCSPQSIPGIQMQECDNNFLNYDQGILMDLQKGSLVANSKNDVSKFPQKPWKDNGTMELSSSSNPKYMALCDGTNSYDNTGIIPMIRAWQMYEQPKDLQTKTYTIFYMDGIDPSDVQAHGDIPSYSHFAKLFAQGTGQNTPQPDYGLVVFPSSVNDYDFVWESVHAKDTEGNDVYMKLFYYEGLETIDNAFVGVKKGIKLNLVVLNPYTNMDTKYGTYQDLDNNGYVNTLLIRACQDLDTKHNWIEQLFTKPPLTFGCVQAQCVEGHGSQSKAQCLASSCTHKPPPPKTSTYGCVNQMCVQGKGTLSSAQCALGCNYPTLLAQDITAAQQAFPFVLVAAAIFLAVFFVVAHHHHTTYYGSSSFGQTRKRKRT